MITRLKLYIWVGFCPDRTGGLAVAIAETVDEAKLLVQAEYRPLPVWDWGTLSIHDIEKCAYCVDGAGSEVPHTIADIEIM